MLTPLIKEFAEKALNILKTESNTIEFLETCWHTQVEIFELLSDGLGDHGNELKNEQRSRMINCINSFKDLIKNQDVYELGTSVGRIHWIFQEFQSSSGVMLSDVAYLDNAVRAFRQDTQPAIKGVQVNQSLKAIKACGNLYLAVLSLRSSLNDLISISGNRYNEDFLRKNNLSRFRITFHFDGDLSYDQVLIKLEVIKRIFKLSCELYKIDPNNNLYLERIETGSLFVDLVLNDDVQKFLIWLIPIIIAMINNLMNKVKTPESELLEIQLIQKKVELTKYFKERGYDVEKIDEILINQFSSIMKEGKELLIDVSSIKLEEDTYLIDKPIKNEDRQLLEKTEKLQLPSQRSDENKHEE